MLKIGDQLIRCEERILALPAVVVAMISLTGLIIVSNYAFATHHVCKPILVAMFRAYQRFGNAPKNKFSKSDL